MNSWKLLSRFRTELNKVIKSTTHFDQNPEKPATCLSMSETGLRLRM